MAVKEELCNEKKETADNAVKKESSTATRKRPLPVPPTSSKTASASSGSTGAVIAPTKKVKVEDNEEKSWWDTAQYDRQNAAWYSSVQKLTDEGHRSGNLNKLLLLMAQYELGNWNECSRLIDV